MSKKGNIDKEARMKELYGIKEYVPLTTGERKAKWNKIFDLATLWVEDCVMNKNGGGFGIAQDSAKTAMGILTLLDEQSDTTDKPVQINIRFKDSDDDTNGYDVELPESVGQGETTSKATTVSDDKQEKS